MGADVVVGSAQRFGTCQWDMGGPHFRLSFATKEAFKRTIPGRIIGVSNYELEIMLTEWLYKLESNISKREKQHQTFVPHRMLLAVDVKFLAPCIMA